MAGGKKRKKKSQKEKDLKSIESEKRKRKNEFEEDDVSTDDDLPCALSPKKKSKFEFETGDLVFAKYRNFPYWPALFHKYDVKQRRGRVYFFEESTIDNKKTLAVPITSIKSYSCKEKDKYIAEGTQRYKQDFQCGLERALEYLQKRAFLEVPEFFADEEDKEEEEENEEFEKNGNQIVNDEESKEPEQSDDESNELEQHKPLNSSIFKLARKSERKLRAESKPYMKWIKKYGKEYLYKIRKGIGESERHQHFFTGTQKQRDGLKYKSGYGPVKSDDHSEKLFNLLMDWYEEEEEFDDPNVNTITYISDVWLPEQFLGYNCIHQTFKEMQQR